MSSQIEAKRILNTLYSKSKDYQVRAKTIQAEVEKCCRFYERQFPETKFNVWLYLLDQSDWLSIPYMPPYGMPGAIAETKLIYIAADKEAGKLLGEPDKLANTKLSKFDNIALHELGHIFLLRMKSADAGKKWANEFLAAYFAIYVI